MPDSLRDPWPFACSDHSLWITLTISFISHFCVYWTCYKMYLFQVQNRFQDILNWIVFFKCFHLMSVWVFGYCFTELKNIQMCLWSTCYIHASIGNNLTGKGLVTRLSAFFQLTTHSFFLLFYCYCYYYFICYWKVLYLFFLFDCS